MNPDVEDIHDGFLHVTLDRPDDAELAALEQLREASQRNDWEGVKNAILDYLNHTIDRGNQK